MSEYQSVGRDLQMFKRRQSQRITAAVNADTVRFYVFCEMGTWIPIEETVGDLDRFAQIELESDDE